MATKRRTSGRMPKIDTVPLPEKVSIPIPKELVAQFRTDAHVVLRHPWIIGIPVPWKMLADPRLATKLKGAGYEVMIVPGEGAMR